MTFLTIFCDQDLVCFTPKPLLPQKLRVCISYVIAHITSLDHRTALIINVSFVYFFLFVRYAINSDQKHLVFRVEERVTNPFITL